MMNRLLSKLGYEKRSVSVPWPTFTTVSGINVNEKTAQSISAVYACVSAISETIASLPLHLYERTDQRPKAKSHSLYEVLHDIANPYQTALEFREWMQACVLLKGNAYARIERGSDGQVRALHPIHPDRVVIHRGDTIIYEYSDHMGKVIRLLQDEMFHLKHRAGDDVLIGISPIQAAREVIELAAAERDHGNATFNNGTRLSGILKFPQHLKPEQRAGLKSSWDSQYQGGQNAGKTAILDQGVEYQTISMNLTDAQWIEARKFSVEEVARLFRVPPTVIGDLTHGNFSNSVEMSRQFVTLSLRRHLVMWEQAVSKQLLTPAGRRKYKPEHSVEGLLRGDSKTRADFYKSGIEAGWLLPSEARRLENLPKIVISDKYKPKAPPKYEQQNRT